MVTQKIYMHGNIRWVFFTVDKFEHNRYTNTYFKIIGCKKSSDYGICNSPITLYINLHLMKELTTDLTLLSTHY